MTDLQNVTPEIGARERSDLVGPREFIKRLQKEHPTETIEEIGERYKKQVRDNTEFANRQAEALVMWPLDEWLKDVLSGHGRRGRPPLAPEQRAEQVQRRQALVAEMEQKHEAQVEAEVSIRLLEYQTTYGKPLGDCTGAECRRLAQRYGGFFTDLANRLNPGDHVRNYFTESQLQAIAHEYRLVGNGAAPR